MSKTGGQQKLGRELVEFFFRDYYELNLKQNELKRFLGEPDAI